LNERLPASLACACLAVESGVQIIRAHDVAETVQAVRMAEALLARKKN
jgi:dihydropteroate synthase